MYTFCYAEIENILESFVIHHFEILDCMDLKNSMTEKLLKTFESFYSSMS